jgi:trans-2,3-dihydro-3-hydroxyanthranilate isomerase
MPTYPFYQLDVFTRQAFGGNQLAVFPDARGLSTAEMQTLTREMNFSESSFVLPPEISGADWKVRIFTPAMEMPMAGHPTVGTAALLAHLGLISVPTGGGEAVLELGIGAVPVIYEPAGPPDDQQPGALPFVWMKHRAAQFGPIRTDRAAVAAALGLAPDDLRGDLPLQTVSTGVPFLFVPLVSLDAASRARSERDALARLFDAHNLANVAIFTEEVVDPQARVHCRMYAPHLAGIVEDPATGSMAAPLGAYLAQHGLLPEQPVSTFLIEQGLEMLRPSQIAVEVGRVNGEIVTLRIGGSSVLVGKGEIFW